MARLLYITTCVVLLATLFCIGEMFFLRDRVYAYEDKVVSLTKTHSEILQTMFNGRKDFSESLSDTKEYWEKALKKIDTATYAFTDNTENLKKLFLLKEQSLQQVVKEELDSSKNSINRIQKCSSENKTDLNRLKRIVSRSCTAMKKAMIYPTVQLNGIGTVGSGVIIFSGPIGRQDAKPKYATYILTAYHVLLEVTNEKNRHVVENVRIMNDNDRLNDIIYKAKVITFDKKKDITLLELLTDKPLPYIATFVPLDEIRKIEVFEPVYAVGCPLGNMPLPNAGEITTKHFSPRYKNYSVENDVFWMLNAPTFFGNSGGGVFRAKDGKLIGISSMVFTYGQKNPVVVPHLGLFLPGDAILDWLKEENFGFIYDPKEKIPDELLTSTQPLKTKKKNSKGKRNERQASLQSASLPLKK